MATENTTSQELFSHLFEACNILRGPINQDEYKSYDYPTFHLSMDCFWAKVESGELVLKEAEAARWLTVNELDSVQWLPADLTLIEKIRKMMRNATEK